MKLMKRSHYLDLISVLLLLQVCSSIPVEQRAAIVGANWDINREGEQNTYDNCRRFYRDLFPGDDSRLSHQNTCC